MAKKSSWSNQIKEKFLRAKSQVSRAGSPKNLKVSAKETGAICDKVSKISIYLLVFLLPLFFLPWTSDVLDFNKQVLLIILVVISLFAWMLKILTSGMVVFRLTKLHIAIGVLFLVSLISTIFSFWRYGSFWGWPLVVSESLLTLIGFILIYFLLINLFKREEIFFLVLALMTSAFLAMLFGVFQLFGRFLFNFNFAKAVSFNTLGTIESLAVFGAVILPLAVILIISSRGFLRIFFGISGALALALLILINSSVAWWLVMLGSVLIIVFGIQRREHLDHRWLLLPMCLLALAIFFSFFQIQFPGLAPRPVEVLLTHRASLGIAGKSFLERPIFGSGPATFVYGFSKYKKESFNQNPFWNVRFRTSRSKILGLLATGGAFGILSFLGLLGFFVFLAVKFLLAKAKTEESEEEFSWRLSLGLLISFLTLTLGYFLYRSNLTLDFLWFLLLAAFVSLMPLSQKKFILKPSSLINLSLTFAFILVFIFSLGIFIIGWQRYSAEAAYAKGIKAWQKGRVEEGLKGLEGAAKLNSHQDSYWRGIAQIYLRKISDEARTKDLSRPENVELLQIFINNAVNSAKAATDMNPRNVANWSVRGFVYQNLIGAVGGAEDWSKKSYNQAIELEPANPYLLTQKGMVLLREGGEENLKEAKELFDKAIEIKPDYAQARFQTAMFYKAQGKLSEAIAELEETKKTAPDDVGLAFQLGLVYYQNEDYKKAEAELERAVVINPNYANALYFLGLDYDAQGKTSRAIEQFEKVARLNPGQATVKKILDNLRDGKRALAGISEKAPPEAPIQETPPELE